MSARVAVRRGAIYLPASLVETYFRGVEAVVVLIRDGVLQILPVRQMAAGGCLLKVRNAAGDRVATAPDVFLEHGLDAWSAEALEARWSREAAALLIDLPSAESEN
ncbi:MAG: hypothetical protein Kilf2KO_14030 [Rhodospirillales bacterium]